MFGPIVTQRKTKRTATNRFSAGVLGGRGGERKLEVKVTEIKLYLIVIMKGFS